MGVILSKDGNEKCQEKMEKTLQENKKSGKTAFNPLVGKAVSRGEILVRSFFKYYFPKESVFYNLRPDFLKFKNGFNLELDIYYPQLKLAVEFQGLHHQLEYQKEKDEFKRKICLEKGIKLIEICSVWYLFKLKKELKLCSMPKWLKIRIRKYKKSRKGKFGKYVRFTERKLKQEKNKRIQEEEIISNKRRLARKI